MYRPKHGSPELEVKLVADTLLIVSEIANTRALYMIANSVNRPKFRESIMERQHYITIIEYLIPPKKQLLQYKNRNGSVIRNMEAEAQANVNLAACICLTTLTNQLDDTNRVRLVANNIIPNLLLCYAMSTREDVKNAALGCLNMYGVSVGHRIPNYPDNSTKADTFFDDPPPEPRKKRRAAYSP